MKKMKKLLLVLVMNIPFLLFAQGDVIKLHNGKTIEGKVIKNADELISYNHRNETTEQVIGKYAVESIMYGQSGRVEEISQLIEVNGKADWQKVVVLYGKEEAVGLNKKGDVKGKTGFINYHTANTGDKKAEKKLKEAAAAMNCPFILIVSDKDTNYTGARGKGFGNVQAVKKGIAYAY